MLKHPHPSTRTVKLLYARALHCAHPNCVEPLYRENILTGDWLLNSRICHIHARSEEGPRWNQHQSPEENSAEANLLLMCTQHSSEIDSAEAISFYSEDKLRDWKTAQIAKYRNVIECGWPLTNRMVEDVLSTSFPDFNLSITSSTVSLGGEGGRAPGSGGGGGGAIGPGARAGKGGKGGKVINSTNDSVWLETMLAHATETFDRPPGSGGAGAGAVGANTVAGDGGDGGDVIAEEFNIEVGDVLEIQIGAGGSGAETPGQHGTDGEDTIVVHKDKNGEVKRVTKAAGGKGGKSGEPSEDWLTITEAEIIDGFQISTLLTANSLEFYDGRVSMLGGAWSRYNVLAFPVQVVWPCLCIATWQKLDTTLARGLQLRLINPLGLEVSCIALKLHSQNLSDKTHIWICNLPAMLDQEGIWRIRVTSKTLFIAQIQCEVKVLRT